MNHGIPVEKKGVYTRNNNVYCDIAYDEQGREHGPVNYFYEDGMPQILSHKNHGRGRGLDLLFFPGGYIRAKIDYDGNGMKTGVATKYSEQEGHPLIGRAEMVGDKKHGERLTWK